MVICLEGGVVSSGAGQLARWLVVLKSLGFFPNPCSMLRASLLTCCARKYVVRINLGRNTKVLILASGAPGCHRWKCLTIDMVPPSPPKVAKRSREPHLSPRSSPHRALASIAFPSWTPCLEGCPKPSVSSYRGLILKPSLRMEFLDLTKNQVLALSKGVLWLKPVWLSG